MLSLITRVLVPDCAYLDELLESTVERRADVGNLLPEVHRGDSALGDTLRGELKLVVDILVGTRGTEAVEAELFVSVALPAHGGQSLDGQMGDTVGQNREAVLLALGVENLEAGHGDNTGLDALLGKLLDGIDSDGSLGASGDKSDLGTLNLLQDVTALGGLLNGSSLKLGQVLARQSDNAGSLLGGQSNVVSSAGLVTVSRAPNHAVGEGTEVSKSLNRLVSRTVLSKSNGVVGGNPDNTVARESGQTDGTGSVRDEVEESTTVR